MSPRVLLAIGGLLLGGACHDNPAATTTRSWKATIDFRATRVEWAGGAPFTGATSTFAGRCSVPSDYVITAAFDGEEAYGGRITGSGGHCTQLLWTPQGPAGVTYSDGSGTLVGDDGSQLSISYGNGTSGTDSASGATWFRDEFTFRGGTGRFDGAAGGGEEGGTLTDLAAVLGGRPVPMWMEGTITCNSAR